MFHLHMFAFFARYRVTTAADADAGVVVVAVEMQFQVARHAFMTSLIAGTHFFPFCSQAKISFLFV